MQENKILLKDRLKVRIMAAIVLLVIVAATSSIFYQRSHTMVLDNIISKATLIAEAVASEVTADMLIELTTAEDMEKAIYHDLGERFQNTMALTGVEYMYILRRDTSDEYSYVIEGADYGTDNTTIIGEVEKHIYDGYKKAFKGDVSRDDNITQDEDGTLLSAYAPILSKGKVIAIVGVDYNATNEYKAFTEF